MATRYTHFSNLSVEGDLAVGAKGSETSLISNVASADTSTIVVGTEAATVINVAVQFNDANGTALTGAFAPFIYFSDDAAGQTLATTAIDTVAIGTDGTVLVAHTAGKAYTVVSEADGDLDLDLTQDAADTLYMQIVMPDGRLLTSDAITWAG